MTCDWVRWVEPDGNIHAEAILTTKSTYFVPAHRQDKWCLASAQLPLRHDPLAAGQFVLWRIAELDHACTVATAGNMEGHKVETSANAS